MCLASNQEPVSVSSWVTGRNWSWAATHIHEVPLRCKTRAYVCVYNVSACVRCSSCLRRPVCLSVRSVNRDACARTRWHIVHGNRQRLRYAALIHVTLWTTTENSPNFPSARIVSLLFLVRRPEELFPRVRRWWVLKVWLILGAHRKRFGGWNDLFVFLYWGWLEENADWIV